MAVGRMALCFCCSREESDDDSSDSSDSSDSGGLKTCFSVYLHGVRQYSISCGMMCCAVLCCDVM